ncbi:hypothetical protein HOG17_03255 [Candidatus Peregrinibacteria bacterium]|jgi:tetratricopeptide (TPR) repeat protein|nr:hypothetical protein [Candidatus Peregrinibacteria bacterium]MBT4148225.1 hypothetical protein [Candidatus Peregrinibacteria bacterium]MBT4455863.1 hypothetical protein [Candidatus Peregrinibacteria bacterium]MBT6052927.1 hypothetical protein [Candidatus Scalindua sp.]
MDIQELTNKAAELNIAGEKTKALKLYNEAFEMLADEAAKYAHKQPETFRDETTVKGEKIRTVLPKLFDETKKHLKKNNTAYILLKNMAVIYHEVGDEDSAINALKQAIELAPTGYDCSDALNGLEKLI